MIVSVEWVINVHKLENTVHTSATGLILQLSKIRFKSANNDNNFKILHQKKEKEAKYISHDCLIWNYNIA